MYAPSSRSSAATRRRRGQARLDPHRARSRLPHGRTGRRLRSRLARASVRARRHLVSRRPRPVRTTGSRSGCSPLGRGPAPAAGRRGAGRWGPLTSADTRGRLAARPVLSPPSVRPSSSFTLLFWLSGPAGSISERRVRPAPVGRRVLTLGGGAEMRWPAGVRREVQIPCARTLIEHYVHTKDTQRTNVSPIVVAVRDAVCKSQGKEVRGCSGGRRRRNLSQGGLDLEEAVQTPEEQQALVGGAVVGTDNGHGTDPAVTRGRRESPRPPDLRGTGAPSRPRDRPERCAPDSDVRKREQR